ncbi:N-(5'-phosphoribosyl)anthranilate isomerase [Roseicyclus marinus]
MSMLPEHLTPEVWLEQVLSSAEARSGGVVKRQIRDIERLVGRDAFLAEAERRGFQVVQNNRHFVIFCNLMPIRRVRAVDGRSNARP